MDSPDKPRERAIIAVALASVAGFIDAVGYVTLDLFTAHMSGNTTRFGVYLGHGMLLRAAPAAFAVAVFVAAIAAGTIAMELGTHARMRSPAALVITVEAVLLVLLAVWGSAVALHGRVPRSSTAAYYGLAALAVVAMGLQTSTLQRISGRTVRTTYVSGMLTNLAEEIANYGLRRRGTPEEGQASYLCGELGLPPAPRSPRRITLIISIWGMYVVGAVTGSYLQQRWQLRSLAVPIAVLVALAAAGFRVPINVSGAHDGQPSP